MMTEALIFLSQPETMPFSISLVLMALIGAVSLLGLDFEVGPDAPSIDMDIDADAGIDGISIIDWVNPGRLPFLAALALFLMIYSLIGLAGQQFLEESTGMLPAWLAGIAARARHFITIIQKHTEYILMLNAWDISLWEKTHDRSVYGVCSREICCFCGQGACQRHQADR